MTGIAALLLLTALIAAIGVIGWMIVRSSRSLATVAQVIGVATLLGSALWVVSGVATTMLGDVVTASVPLKPFRPHPAAGLHLGHRAAEIVGGGIDSATLDIRGLDAGTRALLASSLALQGVTVAVVAVVVVRLARSLGQGDPFRLGARALLAVAGVIAVGGVAWSVTGQVGSWLAGREALEVTDWSTTIPAIVADHATGNPLAQYGWAVPAFQLEIPFWPLSIAFVIALLAAVFRAGALLRRETEGLV